MNTNERKEPSFFGSISNFFHKAEDAVVVKVDHVLAAFHGTVSRLEAVEKAHIAEAQNHAEIIKQRTVAKLAAEAEAVRASSIAQKLKAIFN